MTAATVLGDPMPDYKMETALAMAVQERKSSRLFSLLYEQNGYRVFRCLCLRGVWKQSGQGRKAARWLFRNLHFSGPHLNVALLVAVTQGMFEDALKLLEKGCTASRKMHCFVKSQLMSRSDWRFLSTRLLPHLSDMEKKQVFLQSVRKGDFRKAAMVCCFPQVLCGGDLYFLAAICFHVDGLQGVVSVADTVKPMHEAISFTILKYGFQVAADCIVDPVSHDALRILRQEIFIWKSHADLSDVLLRLVRKSMQTSVFAVFLGLCVDCRIPKQRSTCWCLGTGPRGHVPPNVPQENVSLLSILGSLAKVSFLSSKLADAKRLDASHDQQSDFDLMHSLVQKAVECGGAGFLLKCCRHDARQYGMEANQRRLICTSIRHLLHSPDDDTFHELAMCHTSCSTLGSCLFHCIKSIAETESEDVCSQICPRLEQWLEAADREIEPFLPCRKTGLFGFVVWCVDCSFPNVSLFVSLAVDDWEEVVNIMEQDTRFSQSLCVYGAEKAARFKRTIPFLMLLKRIEDKGVAQAILQKHSCETRVFTSLRDIDRTRDSHWQSFDIVLEHQQVLTDDVIAEIAYKAAENLEWWLVEALIGRCIWIDEDLASDLISMAVMRRNRAEAEQLMRQADMSILRKCSPMTKAIYADSRPHFFSDGHMVSWCVRMGLSWLHCSQSDRCPMEWALTDRNLPLARLLFVVGACPSPARCYFLESSDEELDLEPRAVKRKRRQVQKFMSVMRKPRSLQDICRLKVSRMIGFFPEREQKAKALGLPTCMVSAILFEGDIAEYEASNQRGCQLSP